MTPSQPTKPDASLLEGIFPPQRISKSEIGGIAPELDGYIADFGDRAWTEVEDRFYQNHNDAYGLMDHETLIHYIAGFMHSALSEYYADDAYPAGDEMFVFFAASNRFVPFCELLTISQRNFVIQFIDYYIQSDFYSADERIPYAVNREQILLTPERTP